MVLKSNSSLTERRICDLVLNKPDVFSVTQASSNEPWRLRNQQRSMCRSLHLRCLRIRALMGSTKWGCFATQRRKVHGSAMGNDPQRQKT